MNRQHVFVIVIAVVVTLLVAAFSLGFFRSQDGPEPSWDYINIRVNTTSITSYELILPVPVDDLNTPWYLTDSLSITDGNASWNTVLTEHGLAFRITGNDNVSLRAEAPARGIPYLGLSPQNRTGGELRKAGVIPYLVFVNTTESADDVSFYMSTGSVSPGDGTLVTVVYGLYGDLQEGWQEIWGDGFYT